MVKFSSEYQKRFSWLRFDRPISERKKIDFLSENGGGCNVFDGDWIWDDSYPLYNSRDCKFLDEGFRCTENGRPDLFYTKWRWQPKACNLPRFLSKVLIAMLYLKFLIRASSRCIALVVFLYFDFRYYMLLVAFRLSYYFQGSIGLKVCVHSTLPRSILWE